MNRAPRASLSIDLLTDADYGTLVQTDAGLRAFAVFVVLVVAGRERLLRGKAARVEGTDALRFTDDTSHICRLTHVSPNRLASALATLAEVAEAVGEQPWAYIDATNRLNIRSYFKFNGTDGWGGSRPNAGRRNQDEINLNSSCNQVGAPPIPSPIPSPTSGSKKNPQSPSPPTGGRDGRRLNIPASWDGWVMQLHDLCDLHPFEWVQRAIDDCAGQQIANVPRYLARVLVGWKAAGGPPAPPKVHAASKAASEPEPWSAEEQREYYAARYAELEAEEARKVGA